MQSASKSLISLNIPSHTEYIQYISWNKDQLCITSATPDVRTAGICFHFTFLNSVEKISVTLRSRTTNLQIYISTMLVIDMPADYVIIPKRSRPQSTAWDRICSKSRISRLMRRYFSSTLSSKNDPKPYADCSTSPVVMIYRTYSGVWRYCILHVILGLIMAKETLTSRASA